MEMENRYASRGVGAAGLTTGIIGTVLGGMASGIVPNILGGGNCHCNEDHVVSRYEASQQARIAELETEVKLRDSNIYTDSKILELYKYVDGKFSCVESQLNSQAVINAQVTANLSCLQNTVNALAAMTKTVIPITNICPEPMAKYNSWVAPTTTTT